MTAAARREQLLDVTAELVATRGFHPVSIDAVARSAGITRAVIYQHFEDLGDLLTAVIDREMKRARAHVSETTPSDLTSGDPRELLLDSLEAFLHAVRDHPQTWRLVLLAPEGTPPMLRESIEQGRRSVLVQLEKAVRSILRQGDVDDAELTAHVLSAISDEYGRLILTDPTVYTPARLLRNARWWLDNAGFRP